MVLEKDINRVRTQTKEKIKQIVEHYKTMFPDEFRLVIEQIKFNRKQQKDKFASMVKTDFIERALVETPETLHAMFDIRLTDDEKLEFKSKKGVRWFAETYPMFKLAEKI